MTAPMPTPAAPGAIDIDAMVAKTRANIPANLQAMFDKIVLSGMRIMFDRGSFHMTMDALNQPGPMAQKIANGIISLMYILWTKSNKTLPPQLIVPATLVLTLRAFQFLQTSKDPQATKEVLGDATAEAVQGIMDRFGANVEKLPGLLRSGKANSASDMPQATGMIGSQKP